MNSEVFQYSVIAAGSMLGFLSALMVLFLLVETNARKKKAKIQEIQREVRKVKRKVKKMYCHESPEPFRWRKHGRKEEIYLPKEN